MSRCALPRHARDLSSILDGFTDILVNFWYINSFDFGQQATFRGTPDPGGSALLVKTITVCSGVKWHPATPFGGGH